MIGDDIAKTFYARRLAALSACHDNSYVLAWKGGFGVKTIKGRRSIVWIEDADAFDIDAAHDGGSVPIPEIYDDFGRAALLVRRQTIVQAELARCEAALDCLYSQASQASPYSNGGSQSEQPA